MLFTDVLRQVHFPRCICMNAFVKYLFLKCICMAFNGHPSSLILGTSALRHSTWGQRGTLKAGLYGYEQSSKYLKRGPSILNLPGYLRTIVKVLGYDQSLTRYPDVEGHMQSKPAWVGLRTIVKVSGVRSDIDKVPRCRGALAR